MLSDHISEFSYAFLPIQACPIECRPKEHDPFRDLVIRHVLQLIDKLSYCGGECIFKVTFDKSRSSSMATMSHNEVVYIVVKMRVLAKYVAMVVDEVKCILMHLNLMNAWLFKHCNTCPYVLYSLIGEIPIGE